MIEAKGLNAQLTKVDLNMVNEPWMMSTLNYVLFTLTAIVLIVPCVAFGRTIWGCCPCCKTRKS